MILGGASFCVGAILCAFAQDLAMLIIGRVCLGAGVGFANQVYITSLLTVYLGASLSEDASIAASRHSIFPHEVHACCF